MKYLCLNNTHSTLVWCALKAERTGSDTSWRKLRRSIFPRFGSWGNSAELRTQTSDRRLRHPTTNHNNTNTKHEHRDRAVTGNDLRKTVEMPPKKRSSGTPQKKEPKGNIKNGSPDNSDNTTLTPDRWESVLKIVLLWHWCSHLWLVKT